MRIERDGSMLRISLEEGESSLLAAILREIAAEYRVSPPELDPRVHHVWYPMDTLDAIGMSPDEKREWNEALRGFREDHLRKIEAWLSHIEGKEGLVVWSLNLEDAESLMVVVNDHRLGLAAQYEIGESDMEGDLDGIKDPFKRIALFEIYFLGSLIQDILEVLQKPTQGV